MILLMLLIDVASIFDTSDDDCDLLGFDAQLNPVESKVSDSAPHHMVVLAQELLQV